MLFLNSVLFLKTIVTAGTDLVEFLWKSLQSHWAYGSRGTVERNKGGRGYWDWYVKINEKEEKIEEKCFERKNILSLFTLLFFLIFCRTTIENLKNWFSDHKYIKYGWHRCIHSVEDKKGKYLYVQVKDSIKFLLLLVLTTTIWWLFRWTRHHHGKHL